MRTYYYTLFSCLYFFNPNIQAQNIPTWIDSKANNTVAISGNLNQGKALNDLSWAWDSQNACFVSTQKAKFTGNHVLYQTTLPPRAEIFISLTPENENDNFSLYAYSGGGQQIVPDLSYCTSCEADYKSDYNYRGKSQNHTRTVSLRAINNPFTVTIGVVGANGLKSGAYTLEVKLVGGTITKEKAQQAITTYRLPAPAKDKQSFAGKLEEGAYVHDLSWAWSSQNACFVATNKDAFDGHHILYLTEIPTNSELFIELTPKDLEANMSLYAYSISGDLQIIPDLKYCVSCEASFKSRYQQSSDNKRKISLRAVNHPYQVIIGVAGAQKLDQGAFTLSTYLK